MSDSTGPDLTSPIDGHPYPYPLPVDPPEGSEGVPGHWEWVPYWNGETQEFERWEAVWYPDPLPVPPTPLELALSAQGEAMETIAGLIQAIENDRASNPLGNVPVIGTIIGVWNSLRQVDARGAATVEALQRLSEVTRNTLEALREAQTVSAASISPEQGND